MKTLMISTMAMAALLALPESASAKVRGCDYRLAGLRDARIEVARARATGQGLELARARLSRARQKARGEGCFIRPVAAKRVDKGVRFSGPGWWDRHDHRAGFAKRVELRKRAHFAKRAERRAEFRRKVRASRAWRAARHRFDTLVRIQFDRRLTYAERCELDRLRTRWRF